MINQTEDRVTVVICTKLLQKIGHIYSFSTYMKLQMSDFLKLCLILEDYKQSEINNSAQS